MVAAAGILISSQCCLLCLIACLFLNYVCSGILLLKLENEVRDGTWFVASVSKEVLFKSRDRMGTRRAKPLWTEIMELMGGRYAEVRNKLYDDE